MNWLRLSTFIKENDDDDDYADDDDDYDDDDDDDDEYLKRSSENSNRNKTRQRYRRLSGKYTICEHNTIVKSSKAANRCQNWLFVFNNFSWTS